MINILLATDKSEIYNQLGQKLSRRGINLSYSARDRAMVDAAVNPGIDILAIDINDPVQLAVDAYTWDNLKEISEQHRLPVLMLVSLPMSELLVSKPEVNDFILKPPDPVEFEARARRCMKLVGTGAEIIKSGDMVIDLAQAEVYISGKPVELTYKEYELLKFLATNKNRVYKREALLNELWGYDYFGGDRTVDVHIRRLRSKIEDADHTFIETVRNIGYKFKGG